MENDCVVGASTCSVSYRTGWKRKLGEKKPNNLATRSGVAQASVRSRSTREKVNGRACLVPLSSTRPGSPGGATLLHVSPKKSAVVRILPTATGQRAGQQDETTKHPTHHAAGANLTLDLTNALYPPLQ